MDNRFAGVDYSGLPEPLRAGVRRWIEDRQVPGGFLRAVIRNRLSEAVACADDDNLPLLPVIVRWFYNEAPGESWGSVAAFEAWRDGGDVAVARAADPTDPRD